MNLGDLFAQWQAAGIFAYAFPFLLIFALIFGILSKINIFGSKDNPNKGVNAIIALAIAFMALQFNIVSTFFSDLFPRFGVGLSVILVILICLGFFIDFENKNIKWILYITIFVVIIAVLWGPIGSLGIDINRSGVWQWIINNLSLVLFIVIFVGLIVWAVVGGGKKKSSSTSMGKPPENMGS